MKSHHYNTRIDWTGNRGSGTSSYRGYDRTWNIAIPGKPIVQCSNDPLLGGDPSRLNPEDLLISALSACHMLWYLHLASEAGIVVIHYVDEGEGLGEVSADGSGKFVSAVLRPRISVLYGTDLAQADAIHYRIHQYCFIARSLNLPLSYEANYIVE